MINKKIALSLLSIAAALTVTGGAAYAAFSDVAQSTGNTFSTGNADLQIAVDPDNTVGGVAGTYGNDIPAPAISEAGIGPNFNKTYFFWLKNNSTSNITLGLTATFGSVSTTGNVAMADQLNATINCGGGSVGAFSINAWAGGPQNLASSLAPGAQVQCSMVMNLPNVDNTFQNSNVTFNGLFTGTQL